MRISDWSSDVCSSDLVFKTGIKIRNAIYDYDDTSDNYRYEYIGSLTNEELLRSVQSPSELSYGDTGATVSTITGSDIFYMPDPYKLGQMFTDNPGDWKNVQTATQRSEEHTSELQSLMRISYAVFCLKKQRQNI